MRQLKGDKGISKWSLKSLPKDRNAVCPRKHGDGQSRIKEAGQEEARRGAGARGGSRQAAPYGDASYSSIRVSGDKRKPQ